MKTVHLISAAAGLAIVAGCATQAMGPSEAEATAAADAMIKSSFREQGIAKLDRLEQDAVQKACSSDKPPTADVSAKIEAEQMATVKWPTNGQYLGDWKEGEKLAQNGRGMTWTDPAGAKSGGNCYNCHQISKAEISFGTIGPSLYQYGRLRGVSDPASAQSEPIVKYTWGKIYNAKAYSACSNMPRFGHVGVLDEDQIRDIMALLLDPKSPVNAE
ncbi:MAG: sulfur oxidation c-type cytochrome SoxX [Paucibacter sp.]|nr:sulfur oxidation c-type cytochrome SoxX [Roseateles sp.]